MNTNEVIADVFVPNQCYDKENAEVYSTIPPAITSLLDVGCGTGALMNWVRSDIGSHVHLEGITYSKEEAALAETVADKVWIGDLNHFDFDQLGRFDCIVCSHVLEHVNWPERILASLQQHLAEGGYLIVALPNFLHFKPRYELLRGRFRYTDQGVMDRTHFRFFDCWSAQDLIIRGGYQIESLETSGYFPLPGIRRYLRLVSERVDRLAVRRWPGLFGVQFVMKCRKSTEAQCSAPDLDMKGKLPVSVVLTTYNRSALVGKTIDSILNQTFRDFELIICDDCSADSTESVCAEYVRRDPRVRYIRHQTNLGMPGNLNAGIRAARGIYIANLHDGDIYEPTLLEKWKAALDEAPAAAFVFNQYRIVDGSGSEVRIYDPGFPPAFPGAQLIEEYFRRWRFDSPVYGTVMGRRSAYYEAGLFDARFQFIADVDMWLRLASRHDVAFVSEPLIDIPTRDVLPSNWQGWHGTSSHKLLRQIMWEARVRHYRQRPLQRTLELIRHLCFSFANFGWLTLVKAKHGLRRSQPQAA